ncbi:dynein axonemal assembly factor 11-like [Cherax quadricarinatus]
MVKVTPELVRKRAEHNEGELSTLEELSLHQQDIEKIEYLHRWCPRLRILYLQGNLISKIENVGRLRELEYLNLALNNVERVEGLEQCEALQKLDLTANFIYDLTSVLSLEDLPNLKELYLTGNPCTSYRGYREWVLNNLPALEELDGTTITRSERLMALQSLTSSHSTVQVDQQLALDTRAREREEYERCANDRKDDDEDDEGWWRGTSYHTPESRLAHHRRLAHLRHSQHSGYTDGIVKQMPEVRLFTEEGRPINVNSAKLEFHFTEDENNNCFILEVHTYKYLDSSLVKCDVEPWYVRITLKGKVLQLVLLEEVRPDSATARRSQITGHLLITMPKLVPAKHFGRSCLPEITPLTCRTSDVTSSPHATISLDYFKEGNNEVKHLQVSETRQVDYKNIVDHSTRSGSIQCSPPTNTLRQTPLPDRPNSPDFVDDSEVPSLE